jgi:3-hydroxyacyl-[acyl-carrier-protein] dehydratase
MGISAEDIIKFFPIKSPYKYIDRIISVSDSSIIGSYQFKKEEFFYQGHLPGYPITPGAILTESSVQIGLLAFGMYLLGNGHIELSNVYTDLLGNQVQSIPTLASTPSVDLSELPPDVDPSILNYRFFLTSTDMTFKRVVLPGDQIVVEAEKVFFKLNKLKTKVTIKTPADDVISTGMISGFVINVAEWKEEL